MVTVHRLAAIALVLAACGATTPGTTQPTSTVTQPAVSASTSASASQVAFDLCPSERDQPCALPAGTYRPLRFRPAITFVLTEGWTGQRNYPDGFAITSDAPRATVTFASGVSRARDRTIGAAVADLTGYLQKYTGLRPGAPSAARLGRAQGIQLDVVASEDAVGLFLTEKDAYNLTAGQKARFWIVDVGGTTVIAVVESATEATFEEALARAQPVIDSVQFE